MVCWENPLRLCCRIWNKLVAQWAIAPVNTLCMCTESYGQSPAWTSFQTQTNAVFGSFFILEAVMKIVGLGPRRYFQSGWNKFDFTIALAVVADFATAGNEAVGHDDFDLARGRVDQDDRACFGIFRTFNPD